MQIHALDHVQLSMPRGQESLGRRFYGEILGLREVDKPEALASAGGCWFEGPGTAVHLGVEDDFRPARKAHVAFRVRDLKGARQALLEAGVPVREASPVPGLPPRFFSTDLFGNRLEFIEDKGPRSD
jgi:catechol 2,3-dioxygenase-like lactoylglutathione lyase family enzyme